MALKGENVLALATALLAVGGTIYGVRLGNENALENNDRSYRHQRELSLDDARRSANISFGTSAERVYLHAGRKITETSSSSESNSQQLNSDLNQLIDSVAAVWLLNPPYVSKTADDVVSAAFAAVNTPVGQEHEAQIEAARSTLDAKLRSFYAIAKP